MVLPPVFSFPPNFIYFLNIFIDLASSGLSVAHGIFDLHCDLQDLFKKSSGCLTQQEGS